MRSQIDQPLTLRQMAKIGFISPCHFNRTFRQVTGVPPSQFLYALRLDAAKQLLAQTQKKVIDICYEVGYNSVGTFTRRFVDVLGVPPARFRRLVQSPMHPVAAPTMAGAGVDQKLGGVRVAGYVTAPAGFQGLIAVGVFTTPIPQGVPVACAVLSQSGPYEIQGVPEGEFHLFALGLADQVDGVATVDHEKSLRAGGHAIRVSAGTVEGSTTLDLRPPSSFDPPILLAIPSIGGVRLAAPSLRRS
jgi:AraC-like DNA-binding protein